MCDDGQQRRCAMAISAASPNSSQSQVYVPNADGSNPQLITAAPSYFMAGHPTASIWSSSRDATASNSIAIGCRRQVVTDAVVAAGYARA